MTPGAGTHLQLELEPGALATKPQHLRRQLLSLCQQLLHLGMGTGGGEEEGKVRVLMRTRRSPSHPRVVPLVPIWSPPKFGWEMDSSGKNLMVAPEVLGSPQTPKPGSPGDIGLVKRWGGGEG